MIRENCKFLNCQKNDILKYSSIFDVDIFNKNDLSIKKKYQIKIPNYLIIGQVFKNYFIKHNNKYYLILVNYKQDYSGYFSETSLEHNNKKFMYDDYFDNENMDNLNINSYLFNENRIHYKTFLFSLFIQFFIFNENLEIENTKIFNLNTFNLFNYDINFYNSKIDFLNEYFNLLVDTKIENNKFKINLIRSVNKLKIPMSNYDDIIENLHFFFEKNEIDLNTLELQNIKTYNLKNNLKNEFQNFINSENNEEHDEEFPEEYCYCILHSYPMIIDENEIFISYQFYYENEFYYNEFYYNKHYLFENDNILNYKKEFYFSEDNSNEIFFFKKDKNFYYLDTKNKKIILLDNKKEKILNIKNYFPDLNSFFDSYLFNFNINNVYLTNNYWKNENIFKPKAINITNYGDGSKKHFTLPENILNDGTLILKANLNDINSNFYITMPASNSDNIIYYIVPSFSFKMNRRIYFYNWIYYPIPFSSRHIDNFQNFNENPKFSYFNYSTNTKNFIILDAAYRNRDNTFSIQNYLNKHAYKTLNIQEVYIIISKNPVNDEYLNNLKILQGELFNKNKIKFSNYEIFNDDYWWLISSNNIIFNNNIFLDYFKQIIPTHHHSEIFRTFSEPHDVS